MLEIVFMILYFHNTPNNTVIDIFMENGLLQQVQKQTASKQIILYEIDSAVTLKLEIP